MPLPIITPVTSLAELQAVPLENGVLVSVFHIHNPFNPTNDKSRDLFVFSNSCCTLDYLLRLWKQIGFQSKMGPLFLDIQSRQIESDCLKLLQKYDIIDYVFVGSAIPDIFEYRGQFADTAKFAYRISEYEGIENLLRHPELYDWLYIDSLTGRFLLTPDLYDWALTREIKICVVSPLVHELPYNPGFFHELDQYVHISLITPPTTPLFEGETGVE